MYKELCFFNVCTWRTMMVPERRLEGQGQSWYHGWPSLTPRKILWKFHVDIFFWRMLRLGVVLYGGTWRMLRASERRLGGQGHPWCHGLPWLTPRIIPWKFSVHILIRSVSRIIHGITWRTLRVPGRRFREDRAILDFMDYLDTLKVLCQYLY